MKREDKPYPLMATVKVIGPRHFVQIIVEELERQFHAVKTSPYIENSKDRGCHIFLKITGVR